MVLVGWKVCSWRSEAAQNEAIAAGISSAAVQMAKDNESALENANKQEKIRVVYRTIREEIDHANTGTCVLSPEFIRLWGLSSQAASGAAVRVNGGDTRPGKAP